MPQPPTSVRELADDDAAARGDAPDGYPHCR